MDYGRSTNQGAQHSAIILISYMPLLAAAAAVVPVDVIVMYCTAWPSAGLACMQAFVVEGYVRLA
jgi:hypothetical protein